MTLSNAVSGKQSPLSDILDRYALPLVIGLFLLNLWTLWPARISPDGQTILTIIKNGQHTDHLPAFFTYFWSYFWPQKLEWIPMHMGQLALLWGSVFLFGKSVQNTWVKIALYALPFFPTVLINNHYLLREGHFIFSTGLAAALLTYKSSRQEKLSYAQMGSICALLFYATSIKYQMQFLAPVFLFWMVTLNYGALALLKRLLIVAILSFLLGLISQKANEAVVIPAAKNHSWQFVKIYDLTGMSVETNRFLLPAFLKRTPAVDVPDLKSHYDYLWEPLIQYDHSPLRRTQSDAERELLYQAWLKGIQNHPLAYLKHRLRGMIKMATESNVKGFLIHDLWPDKPHLHKYATAGSLFAYGLQFPLVILSLLFGIRLLGKNRLAAPLVYCTTATLVYLGILSVMTLAFVSRYLYICMFFTLISHCLAVDLWLQQRRKN